MRRRKTRTGRSIHGAAEAKAENVAATWPESPESTVEVDVDVPETVEVAEPLEEEEEEEEDDEEDDEEEEEEAQ